ncbi:sensor histidine kinase [Flavobacterium agrisoli]|uniref:histidine kinase n=1 Tax=Flavobacterium agrisoli TaxID=2793066 RepID=A0A934UJZ1_9FLAO|nr:ATP-binding protein [Flavobacterium agrisoli]MBK0370501.1 sensor histidine kinase [Flavobacterium agrisoli]
MALDYEKEVVTVIVCISMFFMTIAILLVVFFYLSRKKLIHKELEKKNLEIEMQNELIKAVIVTQEEERKRIAQDLHDDISSKLNVVGLNGHLLKTPNLLPHELEEITNNIITLNNKALENSRKIAHNLLPPVLEKFGLEAGIRELCLEFESGKTLIIDFIQETIIEQDLNRDLHVFRILQELLNNSVRHGKASKVKIKIDKTKEGYCCHYHDNGVGFDVNKATHQKGLGTKNMASRVQYLNGELIINSAVGEGITVYFTF